MSETSQHLARNGSAFDAADSVQLSMPAARDDGDPTSFLQSVIKARLSAERHDTQQWGRESNAILEANERLETKERSSAAQPVPRWKRSLDVTLIVISAVIWLPVMMLIMLAVKCSSPGPIFFRQQRIGMGGQRFMIYKFRSMRVTSETQSHESYFQRLMRENAPMIKLDAYGDPRIIRCGRLLRASGLDELPQIFNVLRGEMSLVGPRPCTPEEFRSYLSWQQERVNALPGLTGYWQVKGKNKTTFNEMIDMDIFYTKHASLWLDVGIMLKTVPALAAQVVELFSIHRFSLRASNRLQSCQPSAAPQKGT